MTSSIQEGAASMLSVLDPLRLLDLQGVRKHDLLFMMHFTLNGYSGLRIVEI